MRHDQELYRAWVTRPESETPGQRFAAAIRAARVRLGMTQDDLAEEADIGRATLLRWEGGDVSRPEPEKVRRLFRILQLDPREAPVLLGFLTREEMGLPPEPPRVFDVTTEEVIQILQDPNIPDEQKREWVEFLRYRTNRPAPARRPRKAS